MRRTRSRILLAAALFLAALSLALLYLDLHLAPAARARLIQLLAARFDADVQLSSLQVSLLPSPRVTGVGLALRHKRANAAAPPLIAIRRFTARTDLSSLLGAVKRVTLVRLEGLEIHIPPRAGNPPAQPSSAAQPRFFPFLIDTIVADGARLEIAPNTPGKEPLVFDIPRLTLTSAGPRQPMNFRASIDNPTPPGRVESTGRFGPWLPDEPRHTAVSGSYTFDHADLGVFPGIAGILSSTGQYSGVLSRIEVNGSTDTPDFSLRGGGYPVHLTTSFSAIVDGSNGDTFLQPVRARFLHSSFECSGSAASTPGRPGKTIALDVRSLQARVEDLLRLTVKATPPLLTGAADFHAKLLLPPGHADVIDKLVLNGQFGVRSALFSSPSTQQKLDDLSLRAQGRPKDIGQQDSSAASDFRGAFALKDAVMNFSRLSFSLPGALVSLDGTYGLKSGDLDFHGTLLMQAKLSQTTTGFKSFLLKAADPFFRAHGAGSRVPIKITGTRDHPSLALDLHR